MEKIDLKIIKDHPELARLITVRLTVEELSQFAKALLKENEQEEKSQPQDDELLTRKQIAILLKISLPTLHDYTKRGVRSEEHTSELQSHSFISYAVFCLKKKRH